MSYIVCIEGNIASGKTTVLQEIEKKGYKVFYEPYKDNLYLPLFYQNPPKYALVIQLEFLCERYKQFISAETVGNGISFIERSPYTDRFVFVEMLRRQGTLQDIEVELYKKIFETWKTPLPNYTVLLHTPPDECYKRMRERGRGMEESVSLQYLQDLGEVYRQNYNKLGIRTSKQYNIETPEKTAISIIEKVEENFAKYNK